MSKKLKKQMDNLTPRVPNHFKDHTRFWFSSEEADVTTWTVHAILEKPNTTAAVGQVLFDEGRFDVMAYSRSEPNTLFWDWYQMNDDHRQTFRSVYFQLQKPITVDEFWDYVDAYAAVKTAEAFFEPSLAHTEPVCTDPGCRGCDKPRDKTLSKIMNAKEENPMRFGDTNPNSTVISGVSLSAIADASKTDLQTQREYLLRRHSDIESNYRYYGSEVDKMKAFFNIDGYATMNRPKTAKDLLDRIAAGTIKLDEKKLALQDIAIASGDGFEDTDGHWVGQADAFYALDFGDPTPDRAGFEAAKDAATKALRAAKDTIMIGTPEAGLAALQALEVWTPPTTAAN